MFLFMLFLKVEHWARSDRKKLISNSVSVSKNTKEYISKLSARRETFFLSGSVITMVK